MSNPTSIGTVPPSCLAAVADRLVIGQPSSGWNLRYTSDGESLTQVVTGTGTFVTMDIAGDGTDFLAVQSLATGTLFPQCNRFQWSTKSWLDGTAGSTVYAVATALGATPAKIVRRSSDYVVLHEDDSEKVHGTDRARLAVSHGTAGSWTKVSSAIGAGSTDDISGQGIVAANDHRCHVIFNNISAGTWAIRQFNTGNTFAGSNDTATLDQDEATQWNGTWARIVATNNYIVLGSGMQGALDSDIRQAQSQASTTWNARTVAGENRNLVCGVFNGNLRAFHSNVTPTEIQYRESTDGGINWSASDLTYATSTDLGFSPVATNWLRAAGWSIGGTPATSLLVYDGTNYYHYYRTTNVPIAIGSGSMTLTGQAPTARIAHNISPASRAVTIAGQSFINALGVRIGGSGEDVASSFDTGESFITFQINFAIGQAFTSSRTGYLTSASFSFNKVGTSSNRTLIAKLYAVTGTPGVDAEPTGSALASSVAKTTDADVPTGPSEQTFTFKAPFYHIQSGSHYAIVVEIDAQEADVRMLHDTTSPSHGGNQVVFQGGQWIDTQTSDVDHLVSTTADTRVNIQGYAPTLSIEALTGVVNVPAGTVSVTGHAPTLRIEYNIAIPAGGITLTGEAPTALTPVNIDVPAGTITLTGQAPSAEVSYAIGIPSGTITITGEAPTADLSYAISIPSGSISLTGQALQALVATNIDIPTGAITLTGEAPALRVGIAIAIPSGSITLTGEAPTTLTPVNIDVPAGAIVLTGQAPSAEVSYAIGIPSGSISIAGESPQALVAVNIGIPAGAVTITGETPSAEQSYAISIPAGAITISGQQPDVRVGLMIDVPAGVVTITGEAPSAEQSYAIAIASGAISLTGEAPALSIDYRIDVPAGSIAITGHAPTITGDIQIAIPAGAISITGEAPSVQLDIAIGIPAGSITLTGQQPSIAGSIQIDIPDGAITLAGHAPSGEVSYAISIPEATISLSGQAPTITQTQAIAIPAGSISITGQAPSAEQSYAIGIPAGAIALSGQSPALRLEVEVPVGDASVTLTGHAPQAIVDTRIAIPSAQIALTGQAPATQLDISIAIPAGAISFTGYDLEAALSGQVSPGAAQITITGYAPTVVLTNVKPATGGGAGGLPTIRSFPFARAIEELRRKEAREYEHTGAGGVSIGGSADVEFVPAEPGVQVIDAHGRVLLGGSAVVNFVSSDEQMLLLMAA